MYRDTAMSSTSLLTLLTLWATVWSKVLVSSEGDGEIVLSCSSHLNKINEMAEREREREGRAYMEHGLW